MPFSFSLKKSFSFSQACSYFGVLNMGVKCISSFFLMFSVSRYVYSLMTAIIGAIGLILLFYIQDSFGMFCPENLHSNLNFEPDFPFSYVFSKTRRLSLYSNIEHEFFMLHIRRKKGLHNKYAFLPLRK